MNPRDFARCEYLTLYQIWPLGQYELARRSM